MQTAAVRFQVRPMSLGDISQVMEIEKGSFPAMWPPTAFKRELQHNRLARYLVAVERGPQAEDQAPPPFATSSGPTVRPGGLGRWLTELRHLFGGEEETEPPPPHELVVGFVGVWLMAEEAHIVTIAVRPDYRRRGVGELLLIAALELAALNNRSLVTLECRASNLAAQTLYEKYGFRQVGVRPRYYSDNHEDAIIMTTEPIHSAAYRAHFQRLKGEHRQRWGDYELEL